MTQGTTKQDYSAQLDSSNTIIEVWCNEDEVEDIGELITPEEAGETPAEDLGP
jgi:hypothetical protein